MFHFFVLNTLDFFVGCHTLLIGFLILATLKRPAQAKIRRNFQKCTIGCLV